MKILIWLLKLFGLGKWAGALEGAVQGYQAEEQAQVEAGREKEREIDHGLENEKQRLDALPASELDDAINKL